MSRIFRLIRISVFLLLCLPFVVFAKGVHIGPNQTYPNIEVAAGVLRPGDTVFVHAGTYAAYQFVADLHGTASGWIVFRPYQNDAMEIRGGWQFSKCSYLKFENLTFKANAANPGRVFHVENGGSCATQSHHIYVDSCSFLDVGDPVNSAFKFGGVDSFEVNNCLFKNITAGAFDFNSCHYGVIMGNRIENCTTGGHIKGGASFITMERNLFLNASVASWVAFELGGDTGAQFYCPGSTTEVSDLKFYSNVIVGGYRGLALSSAVNCEVVNNTFYECGQATMRFLTTSNLYPTLSGNVVRNNIFAFGAASQYFNGGDQPAGAVSFNNNIYYSTVSPTFNGPYWDTPELDRIKDPTPMNFGSSTPMFVNAVGYDFHLTVASPAVAAGYPSTLPMTDYFGNVFNAKRSIGAVEFNSIPSNVTSRAPDNLSIDIFPNPSTGYVIIRTGNSSGAKVRVDKIEVFDAAGVQLLHEIPNIRSGSGTHYHIINLSGLPAGVYTVRVGEVSKTVVYY